MFLFSVDAEHPRETTSMHLLRSQRFQGINFDTFLALARSSRRVVEIHLLRSLSIRRSRFVTFLRVKHPGYQLRCTVFVCGATREAALIRFYVPLHTWGGLFDMFVAGAGCLGEQLRFIFCGCGASRGAEDGEEQKKKQKQHTNKQQTQI